MTKRSIERKAIAATARNRAAMTQEMAILIGLDPSSAEAAKLKAVIDWRISRYVAAPNPKRIPLAGEALVGVGLTTVWAVEYAGAETSADLFVYGAACAFFGAMGLNAAVLLVRSFVRRPRVPWSVSPAPEAQHGE